MGLREEIARRLGVSPEAVEIEVVRFTDGSAEMISVTIEDGRDLSADEQTLVREAIETDGGPVTPVTQGLC